MGRITLDSGDSIADAMEAGRLEGAIIEAVVLMKSRRSIYSLRQYFCLGVNNGAEKSPIESVAVSRSKRKRQRLSIIRRVEWRTSAK
jgi:hypothetical protein